MCIMRTIIDVNMDYVTYFYSNSSILFICCMFCLGEGKAVIKDYNVIKDYRALHYSSALWLYEYKFQMVSGYSTLVQFQSGTREKIRALHYNAVCSTFFMYLVQCCKCYTVQCTVYTDSILYIQYNLSRIFTNIIL